jgi:hypothetical protein
MNNLCIPPHVLKLVFLQGDEKNKLKNRKWHFKFEEKNPKTRQFDPIAKSLLSSQAKPIK